MLKKLLTKPSSKQPEEQTNYASFDRRLVAVTIDIFMIFIISIPLIKGLALLLFNSATPYSFLLESYQPYSTISFSDLLSKILESGQLWKHLLYHFSSFFILYLYIMFCWIKFDATLGKQFLKLKIVKTDGSKPSAFDYHIRLFSYLISMIFFFLGFFWIYFNKKRRAWHDYLAGTYVIKLNKKSSI